MKTIIALLFNLPMLLWLALKPPSKAELLRIIEAEKAANRRLKTEIQNEQSTLLSK